MSYEDTMDELADLASENNELKKRIEELEALLLSELDEKTAHMLRAEKYEALIDRAIACWDDVVLNDKPTEDMDDIVEDMRKAREDK